jgi:hypothetical protein
MRSEEDKTRRKARRSVKDKTPPPLFLRLLLAIPKNLVYIFIAIIFFAFGAVLFINYTEYDLTEFLEYDMTREVVIVDPVFSVLQSYMAHD